jgi:hypothetical protein
MAGQASGRYGARIYRIENGLLRIVQTVKAGTGHNEKYHEDVDQNDRYRQRFVPEQDDGGLLNAIHEALAGTLTHQGEPEGS